MAIAKVFMSGRSQAVRLPLEFRFDTAEVYIRRTTDGGVLLTPKRGLRLGDALAEAFDRLPVDGNEGNFERPDQGEHERPTDLFGTVDLAAPEADSTKP